MVLSLGFEALFPPGGALGLCSSPKATQAGSFGMHSQGIKLPTCGSAVRDPIQPAIELLRGLFQDPFHGFP